MALDASVTRRWVQAAVAVGVALTAITLVLPAIQRARETARRSQSKNNLKQIGLALENYDSDQKMLPYGGIFDEAGTPFHSWTAPLDPYLAQRMRLLNPDFPWDDATNIDYVFHAYVTPFQNPSISETQSPDGLPLIHYAANQRLFYRNSVVRLRDVPDKSAAAMLGDANGSFIPLGYPFNWRDLSLGLGTSPDGFGCPRREITMLLLADGSVRALNNKADANVVMSLMGPEKAAPTPQQVAKPVEPYRLKIQEYWRYLDVVRGQKRLMNFALAPDKKSLSVNFGPNDSRVVPGEWTPYFGPFIKGAPVERVEIRGWLRASELVPFLQIATLKRLTISNADIADDKDSILKTARKDIVVD
jgi:type II secretory pathway pseudopilin PulG